MGGYWFVKKGILAGPHVHNVAGKQIVGCDDHR